MATRLAKTLLVSTFLVTAPVGWAMAQDVNAVSDRLKALLDEQGVVASWSSVSGDASEMVLEGVKIGVAGSSDDLPIGNITLSDITEDNGAYTIGSVTVPDYKITEDGTTLAVSGMEVAGLRLGAPGSTDPLANLMLYDSADIDAISVAMGGKEVFAMKGAHAEIKPPAGADPMSFAFTTEGFTADLSATPDQQTKAIIDALGYQQIAGNIGLEGTWQPSDGRMVISQYDVTVDNAGTFGMTLDLGGYTPDFIKSVQEMQKKIAEQPEGADNSAQGLAMLGLMQQLTFRGASIRFDDDSLTQKVLNFAAERQGVKPQDLANQVKALAPIMLAQVTTDQALIKNVSDAVTTFINDPKSIEITAAPAQPLPFALIAAGAMSAPHELPKTLGVTVTANQD